MHKLARQLDPLPPAGCKIGVAISGGADSTALLLLLHQRAEHSLAAIHINHGWRGAESESDAEFCRGLASQLGIPFFLKTLAPCGSEGNPEEIARLARLQFFTELIETKQVDSVVTAHTRDDQAETLLFRLLRGTSAQGLAGIHPVREGFLFRPMLRLTRSDVVSFLEEAGQPWREDASNADVRYRRNRIRHELLPQLERDWNPALRRTLAQTAELAFEDQQFWNAYVAPLMEAVVTEVRRDGSFIVDLGKLSAHPKAVSTRIIRGLLERVKGDLRQLDHGHVEAVLRLVLGATTEGHGRVILPGVDVMRSFEWLRFAPYDPNPSGRDRLAERNVETVFQAPGEAPAPDGSIVRVECDTPMTLTLRNWRPGDRYQPEGRTSPEKLKVMFQEHRIPLWERGSWPVLTSAGEIVWSRKFGPKAGCGLRIATTSSAKTESA